MSSSSKLFVVAIDFGTTYSGYAFSSISNKDQVYTYNWSKGIGQTPKTPTSILFTPRRDFHSFGHEAEEEYARLSQSNQNREWYFYKRFKLTLYKNKSLNEFTQIKDFTGKEMTALAVFSGGIRYLKEHLFNHFRQRVPQLRDDDIHWVLTVPAIWDEKAKKFMRKAAEQADIPGHQLTLALEPESAALYCQLGIDKSGLSPFVPGEKFLLLDCGGGTVDITVHEVRLDLSLKEIHRASGGPWGGIKVDDAFQEYLLNVFGLETIVNLSKNDVVEISDSFESLKKKVDAENKIYNMVIPLSLRQKALPGILTAGRLKIDSSDAKGFFQKPIEDICDHIKQILSTLHINGLRKIILVGGFSESPLLQLEIQQKFPLMNIIIPTEPGSAVVKGAVEFGHCPEKIRFRMSPYTYGVGTTVKFRHGFHPARKIFQVEGIDYCGDVFSIHVKRDQQVETGESLSNKNYKPLYPYQTCLGIQVAQSDNNNPSFIDETGSKVIGAFEVQIPTAYGLERCVNVQMIFSGTELKVIAKDKYSGRTYNSSFNFE